MPSLIFEYNTSDISFLKKKYLEKENILSQLLLKKTFSKDLGAYITTSLIFCKNNRKEISGSICKILDFFSIITKIEKNLLKEYYISLNTNAFFSEIEGYNKEGKITINNSELAYLNTTRLNSYVREIQKLMIEFGLGKVEFSNTTEILNVGEKSKYYENEFLLVGDEVLFYEDVYDILPDECKYKPFEKIYL